MASAAGAVHALPGRRALAAAARASRVPSAILIVRSGPRPSVCISPFPAPATWTSRIVPDDETAADVIMELMRCIRASPLAKLAPKVGRVFVVGGIDAECWFIIVDKPVMSSD